jgi:hypothetical protein
MQLRSGKIYTIPTKKIRYDILRKLIARSKLQTEIMPKLKAYKKIYDFLNKNIDEVLCDIQPKCFILATIENARDIGQIVVQLINNLETNSNDCDFLFSVLDSISAFSENAEDEYIEAYIQQEESYR